MGVLDDEKKPVAAQTGEPLPPPPVGGPPPVPLTPEQEENATVRGGVADALDPNESPTVRKVLGLPGAPPNQLERNQKMLDAQSSRELVNGDDFSNEYTENRKQSEDQHYGDLAESMFGGPDGRAGAGALDNAVDASQKFQAGTAKGKSNKLGKSVALDIFHGAGEAPTQIVGGARDAAQATIDGVSDVANWVSNKAVDLLNEDHIDEAEGIRLLGKDKYDAWKKDKATIKLPAIPAAKTVTGGLIRGTAQFVTAFGAVGKVAKAVGVAGELGAAGNAAKGFAATFAGFDEHSSRLSDLVQSYPMLKNPVNEWLASDPSDSKAKARFKNVIEGLGLGLISDGFIKAVSAVKQFRIATKLQEFAQRTEGEVKPPPDFKPEELGVLGDTEQGLFRKLEAADEAVAGMKPGDVSGKAKAGPEQYINFARIDAENPIKQVIKKMAMKGSQADTSVDISDIDKARRSTTLKEGPMGDTKLVRTWEQTKLSAEQQDAWKLLADRRQGEAFNAEESLSARQLWVTSAEELKKLSTLAKGQPSVVNLFAFRRQLAIHYAIQQEVIAARTETARALNQWKIPAGSSKEMALQMQQVLEGMGGEGTIRDMAEKISMLGATKGETAIEKFVNGTVFAKTRDAVAQVWINSLLSNPATHTANTLSNFSSAFQQIYERKAAEYISQKMGSEGGVQLGEALAMAHGGMNGFMDACRAVGKNIAGIRSGEDAMNFLKKVVSPDSPYMFSGADEAGSAIKYEVPPAGSLSSEKMQISSDTPLGHALDVVDVGTRLPGRMLGQADDFFKSIGYRMELHAQAVRMAKNEMKGGKLTPDEYKSLVANIIESPPPDVKLAAVNQATYQTFQGKPAEVLSKLGSGIQSIPVLGRLLLPFKNTPINIFTYTFERTPLAPLVKSWRQDIAAGGARKDIALARMATGSMLLSISIDQALSENLTGAGPSDPGQRAHFDRMKKQPYSIKVPFTDTKVSYNRVDPLGFQMGIGADIAEGILNAEHDHSDKDFEEAMAAAVFAIGNNITSKTYMKGVSEWMGAVTNPQMKADRYIQRLFGSFVPAGVAAVARAGIPGVLEGDHYQRAANSVVDALRRRIPILSKGLPYTRNLWGDVVDYQSGLTWGYDMFSPIYLKTGKPEPIDEEIGRLDYYPSMPDKKVSFKGVRLQLDAQQYSRYVQLAGNEWKHPAFRKGLKDFLNDLVTKKSPLSGVYEFQKAKDAKEGTTGAAQYLEYWINKYRDGARNQLIKETPALLEARDEKTIKSSIRIPSKLLFQ